MLAVLVMRVPIEQGEREGGRESEKEGEAKEKIFPSRACAVTAIGWSKKKLLAKKSKRRERIYSCLCFSRPEERREQY